MTELMPSLCNDCISRNQCGNDDITMCASYTKEIKIRCDDCKFCEECVDYGWQGCRKFTPKPTEPMTNEEWIKQANTEQLAEVLLHIADSCYWAGFFKGKDDDDGYDDEYCLINQNIVEWLKQPHTKE